MKHKLRMSPDQVTQAVVDAITFLRSLGCNDIEFTPEDAGEQSRCRQRMQTSGQHGMPSRGRLQAHITSHKGCGAARHPHLLFSIILTSLCLCSPLRPRLPVRGAGGGRQG